MTTHRADTRARARRRPAASYAVGRLSVHQPTHRAHRRAADRRLPVLTVVGVTALVAAGGGSLGMARSEAAPHTASATHWTSTASVVPVAGATPRDTATGAVPDGTVTDRARALSRGSARDTEPPTGRPTRQPTNKPTRKPTHKPTPGPTRDHAQPAAWVLPVTHGLYHLTAGFGQCSGLWSHCHTGLDFAAPTGTPIHAVAGGTVKATEWAGAYGNRTVETLPDGTTLWYAHQSAFEVKPGEKVAAGQEIGRVGATGNVTGPHVHLEVRPRPDHPIDPYPALVAHGLHP